MLNLSEKKLEAFEHSRFIAFPAFIIKTWWLFWYYKQESKVKK